MKMRTFIQYENVQETIFIILKRFIFLVLGNICLYVPLNSIYNYHIGRYNSSFTIMNIIVFLFSGLIFLIFKRINKTDSNTEALVNKIASIYAITISIISIFASQINPYIWAVLIVNILVSQVVFDKNHYNFIIFITLLSFGVYILQTPNDVMLPIQKITTSFVMYIAFLTSHFARNVIKELITNIINEASEVKRANMQIATLNETLEKKVEERTHELHETIDELESALDNLNTMQTKLVHSKYFESYLAIAKGLSHQLNTPLGIDLTTATFILQEVEKLKEYVHEGTLTPLKLHTILCDLDSSGSIIEKNTKKAIAIVNSLKSFTEIEEREVFNIYKFLKSITTPQVRSTFSGQLQFNVSGLQNLNINAPPLALKHVLEALFDNAVRHNPNKSIIISIAFRIDNLKNVIFEITDTGNGIGNEYHEHIFDPFFTTSVHQIGMGLFISKIVVEQSLHGTLCLDTDYKNGARFVLKFPQKIDSS